MATRGKGADLRVTIDADAAKLERSLQRAQRDMMRFESQIRSADAAAAQLDEQLSNQRAQSIEKVGRSLLVVGAAALTGLGMATKAAMDWESAWAGVTKTVDGTPEQMAALEKELRNLATTLPASHREIAAVAEAAGQLGVQRDAVVAFTRTMVDLGETTNLTADDAATSIAQLANVMGTDLRNEVSNFGSALVDLGNNGASTERDILEMAQRIGGAGATIGLTEQEVLALSSTLSSVGINAEAGGSAISRVMVDIASAVATGGEKMRAFAEVADMSAQDFADTFEANPIAAIQAFITGLGRVDAAGGNVFGTLDQLGLSGVRVRDVLLRTSEAGSLLGDNVERANEAWEANTALVEEAEKRYDTAEAKIAVARDTFMDFAIDIGARLLPIFVELVDAGKSVLDWLNDLPGPVKTIITVFALLVGGAAALGGAFLLLAPRIAAAQAVMLSLARTAPVMYGALAYGGQFVALIAGLGAVAGIITAVGSASAEAGPPVGEMTEALLKLRDVNSGVPPELIEGIVEAKERLKESTGAWNTFLDAVNIGPDQRKTRLEEYKNQLESVDLALAQLVSGGNSDAARESLNGLAAALGVPADKIDEFVDRNLPEYQNALAQARTEHELTAESVEPVDSALIQLATRFGETGEDAEKAAQKLLEGWREASGEFISLTGAYGDALAELEEKERKRAENAAENSKSEKDTWEDFYKDVTVSIDDFIAKLDEQIEAQRNWHENMAFLAGRVSDDLLGHLAELGPEGADLVQALVDGGEKKLREADEKWIAATSEGTTGITGELIKAQPVLAKIAAEHGQKIADKIAQGMVDKKVDVFTAAKAVGVEVDEGVRADEARNIPINIKTQGYQAAKDQIESIGTAILELPDGAEIRVDAYGNVQALTRNYRGPLATGGEIRGPGGPTEDKAGLWALSDREWVIKAAAAQKYGPKMMAAINAGIADVSMPGMGGPKVNVKFGTDIKATEFSALALDAAGQAYQQMGLGSGRVLPAGSYRIGMPYLGYPGHYGADYPAPVGTPVAAVAAGIVSRAMRLATSYGIHAFINHAGSRQSRYAHLSALNVAAGQQVAPGQIIGRVGSTGNSTGPHLHYEDRINGVPRNPASLGIFDRGGLLSPGWNLAYNGTGGPEMVLDRATTAAMGGPGDLPDALKDMRAASREMQAFAKALRALRRRGLSDMALRAIHDAGPDEGLRQARQILRGRASISEVNRWERQQRRAERRSDRMVSSGGGTPDQVFRDISRAAGKAFLRGIVGDRDEIKNSFEPLFEAIGEVVERPARRRLMGMAKDARNELLGLGKQWERTSSRLEKAADRYQELIQSAKSLRESTRDRITGGVDVTQAMIERRRTDADGAFLVEDRSIAAITETLRLERDRTRKFAKMVERLRNRGLNDKTLQQIIEAGPEEGAGTAQAILKGGRAGIREINQLEKQLRRAAVDVGQTAADSMYAAGIKSARGLVEGLEAEEARIERMMRRIAKSMVNTIKRQLKIKSPSQVFAEEVGRPTGQGIAAGILSAESEVLAATRQIIDGAASKYAGHTFHAPRAFVQIPAGGNSATGGSGEPLVNHWTINGSSEETIHKIENRMAYSRYAHRRRG